MKKYEKKHSLRTFSYNLVYLFMNSMGAGVEIACIFSATDQLSNVFTTFVTRKRRGGKERRYCDKIVETI